MNSFYSKEELETIGLKNIGENVLISRKASIYGAENICIGNNVRIDDFCILSGKIIIGNNIHISAYTGLFAGRYKIVLEDYATISSRCAIYAESDDYSGRSITNPMNEGPFRKVYGGDVRFSRHVIIGSGSTVLPNVILNEGAAVGAMSLVNKDIEGWTINAGIPCRKIRERERELLQDYGL